MSSDIAIDLEAGESSIHIDSHQDRKEFELLLKGSFAAAEAQKLEVPLTAPLDLELNVAGTVTDIKAKLAAEYEDARLAVQAHAQHDQDWTLNGTLSLQDLELSDFGVDQVSPLSADAKFEARRIEGGDVPELRRYSGQIRGAISSFSAKKQPVPALQFEANLQNGQLAVNAQRLEGQGETKISAQTTIDASGELDRVLLSGQLQASHAVPYVTELQHLEGDVQFSGELSLKSQTLDAQLKARLENLKTNVGVNAKALTVEARANGEWADPRIFAVVDGKSLVIGQEKVEQLHARVEGSLSQAHVEAKGTARGLLARVEGDIGLEGSRFRTSNVEGELVREGNRIGVSLGSLSAEGQEIAFEDVALSGIAQGTLSGSIQGQDIRLEGSLRDVSLFQVGQLLGMKLPVSGQIDADVDASLDSAGMKGRIRVEGTEVVVDKQLIEDNQAPVPPLTPLRLSLDVVGEGKLVTIFLDLHEMADVKRQFFEVDTEAQVALPSRAVWSDPEVWWQHLLRLKLNAQGPLQEASRALLPEGWQAQGHLNTRVRLRRSGVGAPPRFASRVATTGLKLVFTRPAENGLEDGTSRESLEDVDLDVRLRHDPSRQRTIASVRLIDQGKRPWLRVRSRVEGSLDQLMAIRSIEDLRALRFELRGGVPRRDVATWPKLVQIEGVRGVWGGRFSAKGTLDRPEAQVSLHFSDWRATQEESEIRLSGGATAAYDSNKLTWETELAGEVGESLVSEGTLEAPWNSRALRPDLGALSMTAQLRSFPLEAVGALELQNIRGPVDLELEVDSWGTPERRAEAQLELGTVMVRGISLEGTQLKMTANAERIQGEVRLINDSFHLKGKGAVELEASNAWLPVLGESMSGELNAKDVPLQLLRPLVSSQLAGLGGRLSAQIQASQKVQERRVDATVQIRDGRVQVPSVGQRLQDINLDLVWDREGNINLKNASFRGTSGKGRLEAKAKMNGIQPQSAELRLIVERDERLPVSLLGMGIGEFWGDIRNSFEFDWEQQKIAIDTKINEFQLAFPELPTNQMQSLDADEHIQVGTRDQQGDWVEVALQPIEQPSQDDPWSVELAVDLGRKFWLQQGPTRRIQIGGKLRVAALAKQDVRVEGQLKLARGRIEINGRMFEVREGTITFQPEEPDNPVIVAAARWDSPEGITVIARFEGPVKSGEMTLTSDPPLPEDQVLSLLLFGDTAGLGSVGSGGEQTDGATKRPPSEGSVASQGLNQALSRIEGIDLSTRVAGGDSGNVRPEVVIQLTNSLSAEVGYNLQEPSPGKSPDRTLLSLEIRLIGGHSLSATVGDRGTSLLDWVWRYRY